MKHQSSLVTFCALFLFVVGCVRIAAPVASGPLSVNSETGIATGQVFGVDFNVAGADGAKVISDLSGSPQSPSRAEITLADDLKLHLQSIDEGKSISLELNGQNFGRLEKGDKVDIGKDRSVIVNGQIRIVNDNPPK